MTDKHEAAAPGTQSRGPHAGDGGAGADATHPDASDRTWEASDAGGWGAEGTEDRGGVGKHVDTPPAQGPAPAAAPAPTLCMAPVADEGDDAGFVTVASSAQLSREDSRFAAEISGRHLAIVRSGGRLYAVDATCYHMGAPLLHGDIEDVPGHGACLVCPWHHYQISMTTGERLYQDMHRATCTLPKKQRVHEVREVNGEVQVRLSGGGKPPPLPAAAAARLQKPQPGESPNKAKDDKDADVWESDRYAFKAPPPSQRGSGGGGGRVRSGQIFQAGRGRGGAQYPGAGSGLHPGLRGRGVGNMVAQSMKGGDGKAPWAMTPGGGLRMPPPPPSRLPPSVRPAGAIGGMGGSALAPSTSVAAGAMTVGAVGEFNEAEEAEEEEESEGGTTTGKQSDAAAAAAAAAAAVAAAAMAAATAKVDRAEVERQAGTNTFDELPDVPINKEDVEGTGIPSVANHGGVNGGTSNSTSSSDDDDDYSYENLRNLPP